MRAPVKSIAAVSLAIAALLLARAVAGLFLHDAIEFSATDMATLAMPFLVLAGASLVNLGFAYLAISTVVTSLGEKARTDELTGLLNRQALTDQINRCWARFTKSGEPFALLCIDIDSLRSVNAAHGYAGGDSVLKEVSRALLRTRLRLPSRNRLRRRRSLQRRRGRRWGWARRRRALRGARLPLRRRCRQP